MNLRRIVKDQDATLSVLIENDDGERTGLTVTVDVDRADGTSVVDGANATEAGSTGVYEYALDATDNDQLDRLTITWNVAASAESYITYADVVGSHYCSLAQMRKLEPLDDATSYEDPQLVEARDLASYALERACNRAFTARYGREQLVGDGLAYLRLNASRIRSIDAVSVGETALSAEEIALIYPDASGILQKRSGTWASNSLITVEYTYGDEVADPRVSRAVALIAREVLFEDALDGEGSGIPERATSINTEAGSFALVTAGVAQAAFDLPEVNAVVNDYRLPS